MDRDQQQHEDPEWHAALQLVGLCVPVADSAPDAAAAIQLVDLSVTVAADSSPNSAAAAAPDVSSKNDVDGSGKDKELEKPDITLPCARCNSVRTKFCYYNNYNVNQPRYYCKDCKRYWTVGGILRDVPIGTAKRKNKSNGDAAGTSCSRSRAPKPLAIRGPTREGNGATTTTSGVLKLLGKSVWPAHNAKEQKDIIDLVGSSDKEEKSCLSSAVASRSSDGAITTSTDQFSVDGTQELVNSGVNRLLLMPPMMPHPGRTRVPTVPSPQVPFYRNCNITGWPNGALSVPQLGSGSTTPLLIPACSGSDSLALGKHPREEVEVEKTFWVPKALRVMDPEEAAKSTIWASLGIELDERMLQPKDENDKINSKNDVDGSGKDKELKKPRTAKHKTRAIEMQLELRNRSRVPKPLAILNLAAGATTFGVLKLLGKFVWPAHNAEEYKDNTDLVGSSENKEEKSFLSSMVASGSSDGAITTSVDQFSTEALRSW